MHTKQQGVEIAKFACNIFIFYKYLTLFLIVCTQAISAVGEVLEYYDSDKLFSVWGFGGKPDPDSPVSHCFNLSKNSDEARIFLDSSQ